MKKVGIIGYGVLGKHIEHFLKDESSIEEFLYFDDFAYEQKVINAYRFEEYLDDKFDNIDFIIGLGYKHLIEKKAIIDNLLFKKRSILSFIHPTSIIDKSSQIGIGSVIFPNVTIDKHAKIGQGCIINLSVTIAHNCIVKDCCFLAPSVTLSGFVSIGSSVFIGTNSCIANSIIIEDYAIVGIGSVITKNISSGQFVIGNPQKIVKNISIL